MFKNTCPVEQLLGKHVSCPALLGRSVWTGASSVPSTVLVCLHQAWGQERCKPRFCGRGSWAQTDPVVCVDTEIHCGLPSHRGPALEPPSGICLSSLLPKGHRSGPLTLAALAAGSKAEPSPPSVSPVTPNPEPQFPKDDDAHPRAAAASPRCSPPPPTSISAINWRTEIPGSQSALQSVKQVEETATHTRAPPSAQNAVHPMAPSTGPWYRGRAPGEPLLQLRPRSAGSSRPGRGPASALSASEAARALRATPKASRLPQNPCSPVGKSSTF